MCSNAMRPVHFARLALQRASADPTTCCWQAAEEGEGERGEPLGRRRRVTALETTARGFFLRGGEIMQFAIWLVGLMCHLSALVRETLQHRLHPKQGSVVFWFDLWVVHAWRVFWLVDDDDDDDDVPGVWSLDLQGHFHHTATAFFVLSSSPTLNHNFLWLF